MSTPQTEERIARREMQAAEGKIAMAEYLAEPERRAANTTKLREARLARDVADAEAAAAAALIPAVKKIRKKVRAFTGL